MAETSPLRIVLTTGEPAGIGPDLLIKLSQTEDCPDFTIIGDPDLLATRAKDLAIPVDIVLDQPIALPNKSTLKVLPVYLTTAVTAGVPNVKNAHYVLETLDKACRECLANRFDAMVTAPIQKSVINDAGIAFSGHTEYLATQCGVSLPVMLLASPDLRIVLVTTHLPLKEIAATITTERVDAVLRIVLQELPRRLGIDQPRITVCGLNPHAGENGYLGTEEQEIIIPVIERLRGEGHRIVGPISADTAFRLEQRQKTDVFVCMYHDQGLPVLKTLDFGNIVNITLGLPIIRTSVDHGTALPLAGTGAAQCDSLLAAIQTAKSMIRTTRLRQNLPTDFV